MRIGTSVNFVVSPELAHSSEGAPLTVWFAMGMCVLSFVACCLASLAAVQAAAKVGAARIIAVDINASKFELAKKFGATDVR